MGLGKAHQDRLWQKGPRSRNRIEVGKNREEPGLAGEEGMVNALMA